MEQDIDVDSVVAELVGEGAAVEVVSALIDQIGLEDVLFAIQKHCSAQASFVSEIGMVEGASMWSRFAGWMANLGGLVRKEVQCG